jgi:hypothetical protein
MVGRFFPAFRRLSAHEWQRSPDRNKAPGESKSDERGNMSTRHFSAERTRRNGGIDSKRRIHRQEPTTTRLSRRGLEGGIVSLSETRGAAILGVLHAAPVHPLHMHAPERAKRNRSRTYKSCTTTSPLRRIAFRASRRPTKMKIAAGYPSRRNWPSVCSSAMRSAC